MIPSSKIPKFFVDVAQHLDYASGWPSCPVWPILMIKGAEKRAFPQFWRSSCAIGHNFFSYHDSDVKIPILCGRSSRYWLCIQLTLTVSPTNFWGQTSSEARIPPMSTISVCYNTQFLWWSIFHCQKCETFLWTSVNTLCMHPVVLHSSPTHFKCQTRPEARIPPFRQFLCDLEHQFIADPDLNVKNADFFCGRPSWPCLFKC